jgi:hypothetical protein
MSRREVSSAAGLGRSWRRLGCPRHGCRSAGLRCGRTLAGSDRFLGRRRLRVTWPVSTGCRRISRYLGSRQGRRRSRSRATAPGCISRACGGFSPRREQRQRVGVALLVGGNAHSEMHVRLVELGRSTGPDGAYYRSLSDSRTLLDRYRPKMGQRYGVAVRRLDGDHLPARGNGPAERHSASRGGDDLGPSRARHVDPTMLAGRILVASIKRERPQNGALCRPAPGAGRSGCESHTEQAEQEEPRHESSSLSVAQTHVASVAAATDVVNNAYVRATLGRVGSATLR